MAKEAKLIIKVDTSQAFKSTSQLREEIGGLEQAMDLAAKAGDPKAYKDLELQLAKVTGEVRRTEEAMEYLDPSRMMLGWSEMASGMVGAFAAVSGAMSLLSGENEKLQEMERKSMILIQTMMGLREMQEKLDIKKIKSLLISTKVKIAETAATIKLKIAEKGATMATEGSTAATRLLGKAMNKLPILMLIAGIATLTAGAILLFKAFNKGSKSLVDMNELMDEATTSIAGNLAEMGKYERALINAVGNTEDMNKAVKDWNDNIGNKYNASLANTANGLADIEAAASLARTAIINLGIAEAAQAKVSTLLEDNLDAIIIYKEYESEIAEINARIVGYQEESAKILADGGSTSDVAGNTKRILDEMKNIKDIQMFIRNAKGDAKGVLDEINELYGKAADLLQDHILANGLQDDIQE